MDDARIEHGVVAQTEHAAELMDEMEVRHELHLQDEHDTKQWKQLLGIKGAPRTTVKWRLRLQLTKPVTWFALSTGVIAGCLASGPAFRAGNPEDVALALFVFVLAGPLMGGFTQTLNDWCDREVDAINEPDRPIPSGAIDGTEVMVQIAVLCGLGLLAAACLDAWIGREGRHDALGLALVGVTIATVYSAEPIRLKERNGWVSGLALGFAYTVLPWALTTLAFANRLPPETIAAAFLFSLGGAGINAINDLKSAAGDRHLGLMSLPVMYGEGAAVRISAAVTDGPQVAAAAWLMAVGKPGKAAAVLVCAAASLALQNFLLFVDKPKNNDVVYMASAMPMYTASMWITAAACGELLV